MANIFWSSRTHRLPKKTGHPFEPTRRVPGLCKHGEYAGSQAYIACFHPPPKPIPPNAPYFRATKTHQPPPPPKARPPTPQPPQPPNPPTPPTPRRSIHLGRRLRIFSMCACLFLSSGSRNPKNPPAHGWLFKLGRVRYSDGQRCKNMCHFLAGPSTQVDF